MLKKTLRYDFRGLSPSFHEWGVGEIRKGNERLLELADFLQRKVPAKRFDYRHWVGYSWKGKQDLSCGTTACALGWAATMPKFRRLGLRLERRGVDPLLQHLVVLKGTDLNGTDAAERIFYLDSEEADFLFTPGYDRDPGENQTTSWEGRSTPRLVAKKIRQFVKDREKWLKKATA